VFTVFEETAVAEAALDTQQRPLLMTMKQALKLINESRRTYLIVNLVYYGVIVLAMLYSATNRTVQEGLLNLVNTAFGEGLLSPISEAYTSGYFFSAIALTFITNVLVGSFVSITLPSLVIPFAGLLIAAWRALVWGLIFSPPALPTDGRQLLMGVLVVGLLILEGQGYVLAMLAAILQGKAFLRPSAVHAVNHWQGYLIGLKETASLYLLVVIVLAVAAVYEVIIYQVVGS
jgi:hypothetical protein